MLTARIELIGHDDADGGRRGAPRSAINRRSTLRLDDGTPRDVEVEDLSPSGFSFSLDEPLPVAIGDRVRVGLDGAGRVEARVVRRDGGRVACTFEPALTARQLTDSFASGGVVAHRFAAGAPIAPVAEPFVRKWPGAVRLGTLLVGAAAGWGVVFLIAGVVARA